MRAKEFAATVGLALLVQSIAVVSFAQNAPDPILATPETIRDFMIQNVCVDAADRVIPGVSPLDDNRLCRKQRDLRPGEILPYHKHDYPSPGDSKTMPAGYQRHDSVPVETAGLGTVVEHSFDFGYGEGRRFGAFESPDDGGDITVLSPTGVTPGSVSFGATEDGGSGFLFWVGDCDGALSAAALARSWIIAEFDPANPGPLQGETVARLGRARFSERTCSGHSVTAWTQWSVRPFTYRALPGQGAPVVLTSLISEHFSRGTREASEQVERFYFTRELGGTRWESWGNANGNRQFSAAFVAKRAAEIAESGRCSGAEPPQGGPPMALLDCREWTRMVSPSNPSGDPAGFFIQALRRRPDAPEFLAAPAPQQPTNQTNHQN